MYSVDQDRSQPAPPPPPATYSMDRIPPTSGYPVTGTSGPPRPPDHLAPVSTVHEGRIWSLQVMQQPIRARMCGFGDKVSRLALTPLSDKRILTRWPTSGSTTYHPATVYSLDRAGCRDEERGRHQRDRHVVLRPDRRPVERRWDERGQPRSSFCHLPVHLHRNLILLSSSTATECLSHIPSVRAEPVRATTDGIPTSRPVLWRKSGNELSKPLRAKPPEQLLSAILPTGVVATPHASPSTTGRSGRNVHQKLDRQSQCQCVPSHRHGEQDRSVVHPPRSERANRGDFPVWNPNGIFLSSKYRANIDVD